MKLAKYPGQYKLLGDTPPQLYVCDNAGAKWCPRDCNKHWIPHKVESHLFKWWSTKGANCNGKDNKVHHINCTPYRRKPDPLGRGLAERLYLARMTLMGPMKPVEWKKINPSTKRIWQAVAREVRRIFREVNRD